MKTLLLLIFTTFSFNTFAEETPSKFLDEVRKDLTSLKADFIQYETFNNGEAGEPSSGNMWLNAPNQFKWNYLDPIPQLIVANGDKVWVYDEDLEQVTIKTQESASNPMYVLLDKEQTEKSYDLTFDSSEAQENQSQTIKLTPKTESDEIKAVWITVTENNITKIKVENQMENVVIFEFSNIFRNPELEADFFEFIPPKGVDVIDDFQFENPVELIDD